MVTEAVIRVVTAFFTFILGLFPTVETPTWLATAGAYIAQGAGFVESMGHVLPVQAMVYGLGLLMLAWGVTLAVRIFRIALSLFTGGGGSAA